MSFKNEQNLIKQQNNKKLFVSSCLFKYDKSKQDQIGSGNEMNIKKKWDPFVKLILKI